MESLLGRSYRSPDTFIGAPRRLFYDATNGVIIQPL